MQVTLKQLISGKWQESACDASTLDQYQGTDTVALIADGYVWCGNEKWYNHYAKKGYICTTTTELMPIIETARQIFFDNRQERIAICEADKIPPNEIEAILAQYPLLYDKEPA